MDNLPKVEIKTDLTKTIEKTYDDTLKEPLKSSSMIVSTVLDFVRNTVMYPMQKYNLYAENKLKAYADKLENRIHTIPVENLISPRVNILGPTIDGLKYNLDEEYIKEMFENLLISDMDNRKQSKVLPAYIEIIKQLSKEDAEFLKLLFRNNGSLCAVQMRLKDTNTDGYACICDYVIYDYNSQGPISAYSTLQLNPLIIDNLQMHRLIELDYSLYYSHPSKTEQYDILTNNIKGNYNLKDNQTFEYKNGILRTTEFGRNFIDICLS